MSDEKKVFGRAEEFLTLFNQGADNGVLNSIRDFFRMFVL